MLFLGLDLLSNFIFPVQLLLLGVYKFLCLCLCERFTRHQYNVGTLGNEWWQILGSFLENSLIPVCVSIWIFRAPSALRKQKWR
jgi:hypothetical protein